MRRRLSVSLTAAMMLSMTVFVAAPAAALPDGNNGNHYGDSLHVDNGNHYGKGAGMGKYFNEGQYRRGLR